MNLLKLIAACALLADAGYTWRVWIFEGRYPYPWSPVPQRKWVQLVMYWVSVLIVGIEGGGAAWLWR
jgi:hypothetical protein